MWLFLWFTFWRSKLHSSCIYFAGYSPSSVRFGTEFYFFFLHSSIANGSRSCSMYHNHRIPFHTESTVLLFGVILFYFVAFVSRITQDAHIQYTHSKLVTYRFQRKIIQNIQWQNANSWNMWIQFSSFLLLPTFPIWNVFSSFLLSNFLIKLYS